MSFRTCGMCGGEATGFASIWTAATGDVPFCHGDYDTEPTCYERAQRAVVADSDTPVSLAVIWPELAKETP